MTDFLGQLTTALPNYLRDLETLVNTDCGTHNKAGVDAIARVVHERVREFGAEVVEFPQPQYGDCLYARWRGKGNARIVMIGHMDTVYSDGKTNEFPFRRVAGKALGCGVIDMKSGLLNGIYAAHAIAQSGFENFGEIGFFFNSEEEVGSPVSKELYAPIVRGATAALVLEGARESGAIVSARKGVGTYWVKVRGKPAHAGVEPQKGANAIYTLAEHIGALKKLNGLLPDLTVNVGVIRGGTRPNVVAETAEAEIDVRFPRTSDVAPFEQAVREITAREIVPGTTTELSGGLANPPMEKTDATAHLVALAKNAAHDLGFQIEDVMTGGGSDGNFTASFGTPTLDGLGPQGGNGHNAMEEYLRVDSIVPRAAMLAKLIVAIASEK
ncbi:MAG: M20 family metallopeptidase [Chloroflexi bacterium]|nr:M20 family metallopeptidase [Chloroflexota bacterium]